MKNLKTKVMFAVPSVLGAVTALAPITALAAEGDVASSVADAVSVVTGVVSLFTVFPMNIFLGMGLAGAGIALFAKAKGASGGKK